MKNKCFYEHDLVWEKNQVGILKKEGADKFRVGKPTTLKNNEISWTPEDLLAATLNSSFMSYFLSLALRTGLSLVSYASRAKSILTEDHNDELQITEIHLEPAITISDEDHIEIVKTLLEKTKKNCPIMKFINLNVVITPQIFTANR